MAARSIITRQRRRPKQWWSVFALKAFEWKKPARVLLRFVVLQLESDGKAARNCSQESILAGSSFESTRRNGGMGKVNQ